MDLSTPEPFRKQIAQARAMLRSLILAREVVDARIADARSLIRANANFLPDQERDVELTMLELLKPPTTIAEAVKISLFVARARKQRLNPVQIKEAAEEHGFDFSDYTNPMATIHTVLRRMKESNPPEVTFNEKEGTYELLTRWPTELANPHFTEAVNKSVVERMWAAGVISEQIANEEIQKAMDAIYRREREIEKDRQYKNKQVEEVKKK